MDLNDIILISIIVGFGYQFIHLFIDLIITRCQSCNMRHNSLCRKFNIIWYKLVAKRNNAEVIMLLDYNNKVHITIANLDATDGKTRYGHTYHFAGIGNLIFQEDGTVENASGMPSHIRYWLPLNEEKRIWMILQGARGFEF